MYNFLKYRTVCALFSLSLVVTFFGVYFYKTATRGSAFVYSVDFTGGTQILYKFSRHISSEDLKVVIEKGGWHNPTMREFSNNETLVRISDVSSEPSNLGEKIKTTLEKEFPDLKAEILQTDSVSAGIGGELRWKYFLVVVLVVLLIVAYIGWRFWSIGYALGAIISLFHDAFVILLFFLLFDREISINFIGALLVVLGYSINDTIVIFSRIRDNAKHMKNLPLTEVVNISINQTLRRTILTSVTTALVTLSLIVLGGEILRDLSLALLVGIVFGTYSSIYIASPVMLLLSKRK